MPNALLLTLPSVAPASPAPQAASKVADASEPATPAHSNSQSDHKFSALLASDTPHRQNAPGKSESKTTAKADALPEKESTPLKVQGNNFLALLRFLEQDAAPVDTQQPQTKADGKEGDALAELEKILQQLLAQFTASTTPSSGKLPTDGAQDKPVKNSKTDLSDTNDAIAEVLNQLLALLAQQPQKTNPAINTSQQDNGQAPAATPAIADAVQPLLVQLTTLLQQKQPASPITLPATATATQQDANALTDFAKQVQAYFTQNTLPAKPTESPATPVLKTTDTNAPHVAAVVTMAIKPLLVSETSPSSPAKVSLTTEVENIAHLVSALEGDKQQDGKDDSNSSANTNSTPQALPAPVQSTASQPADFNKFVATATPHLPPSEQISVQIKSLINSNENQIRVQLSPENLGKVEVQLTTTADGKTGVTITADSRETLQMLQNEARSLENALRDIGLKTDTGGLNFNLRGDGGQQNSGKNKGGYTVVSAIDEEIPANIGTTIASYHYSYNYNLSIQQGLDIQA